MDQIKCEAKRLYAREIFLLCLLGGILLPTGEVSRGMSSVIVQGLSMLSFMIAFVLFCLAAWRSRPLQFGENGLEFGATKVSASKISGVEYRTGRNWLIISRKSHIIPRVILLKLTNRPCNDDFVSQLNSWALENNLKFHRF